MMGTNLDGRARKGGQDSQNLGVFTATYQAPLRFLRAVNPTARAVRGAVQPRAVYLKVNRC